MAVKVMFGDEPYIIDKKVNEIKRQVKCPELNLSCFYELSNAVIESIEAAPVLDDSRVVILILDELNNESLYKVLKTTPKTTELVVTIKAVDKRTSLYKKLKNEGWVYEHNKLTENQLKKFVFDLLMEKEARIRNSAYNQLVEKLNYFGDPNVTLYTVEIYVRQLMYLASIITDAEIQKVVPTSSNEKLYELTKALFTGKADRTFALALDFMDRGENVIGMISMMQRIFRLGYKASLYNDLNRAELGALLNAPLFQFQEALSVPAERLCSIMDALQDAINGIKTGRCEASAIFLLLIGKILNIMHPSGCREAALTHGLGGLRC